MKEKHNGWKVLVQERISVSGWSNSTSHLENPFALHYPIGKTVYPKKGTKLFFFKLKRNAVDFANKIGSDHKPIIVRCVATNPVESKIRICYSVMALASLWDDMSKYVDWESIMKQHGANEPCPKGTYLADAIKCLE